MGPISRASQRETLQRMALPSNLFDAGGRKVYTGFNISWPTEDDHGGFFGKRSCRALRRALVGILETLGLKAYPVLLGTDRTDRETREVRLSTYIHDVRGQQFLYPASSLVPATTFFIQVSKSHWVTNKGDSILLHEHARSTP